MMKKLFCMIILLAGCVRDPLCKPHDNVFNNPAHCGTANMHAQWEKDGMCVVPCDLALGKGRRGKVLSMRDGDDCFCWRPAVGMADPDYRRDAPNDQGDSVRLYGAAGWCKINHHYCTK